LIVLHADGSTKDAVVAGPWRAVADELGCALLAPSGHMPTDVEPQRGMAWTDGPEAYAQRSWVYERPVGDALRAFREQHAVRRDAVFIAGEGTGAMLAFHVAARAPGLYRGVLMCNGTFDVGLAEERARTNAPLDLRVAVLVEPGAPVAGLRAGTELAEWRDELLERFDRYGVAGAIELPAAALASEPVALAPVARARSAALRALAVPGSFAPPR
jgi:pimeloyl-ACP methyl ester carboxylesterase